MQNATRMTPWTGILGVGPAWFHKSALRQELVERQLFLAGQVLGWLGSGYLSYIRALGGGVARTKT